MAPDGSGLDGPLTLELRNPDFRTATMIADAINVYARRRFGRDIARERDHRTVLLARAPKVSAARLMAEIGEIEITPDAPARIVVDARTGTIHIGQDVRVSTVAIAQGNLTIRITETPQVSQPEPFSNTGRTVVVPRTDIQVDENSDRKLTVLPGSVTLQELVNGLNAMGNRPARPDRHPAGDQGGRRHAGRKS